MRILRIIASVDPEGGGPIEGLSLSAGRHSLCGHQTEVATLDPPGAEFLAEFPLKVHALGPGTAKYGYTPKLRKWVRENAHNYDVAVVHGLWNHASIGGWQGLRDAGLPYVIFTHGMMDPWFKQVAPIKHLFKQLFWTFWQGKVLSHAAYVLFTSEGERHLAERAFFGHSYRGKVVAYGSNDPPAADDKQRVAFRALVPTLSSERKFLLFLSRLHPKKGCDLLVRAFSEMSETLSDYDLVIAGPDQEGIRPELEEYARRAAVNSRIHWPGMLRGAAKWGAFRAADAFILPSHQENFGIVIAEALASGTPVLTTRKVNIWREVEGSGSGFVAEDDLDGVKLLLHLWANATAEAKNEMRIRAVNTFEARFTAEAAARDLLTVLHEVLGAVDESQGML